MSKNECVPSVGALCGDHVLSHIESFMFFFSFDFPSNYYYYVDQTFKKTNKLKTKHGPWKIFKETLPCGFPGVKSPLLSPSLHGSHGL